MTEPAFDWERFRVSCKTVKRLDIRMDDDLTESPGRLIGYAEYGDVFRSLIPHAAVGEEGVSVWEDFPEIYPEAVPDSQKTSAALLLTGETGCGRHTADKTAMSVVLADVEEAYYEQADGDDLLDPDFDRFLSFYLLDSACWLTETDRALVKAVDQVLGTLFDMATGDPSMRFYVSLGNVTPVLENQRAARRFVSHICRLTADWRAQCVVTCICDGKAAALPDAWKQPFYVLEFEPPHQAERLEYFHYLAERYPNIRTALTAEQLAEKTEGWTFAMVKQLAAYMMMSVKSRILREHLDVENYLYRADVGEDEIITLSAKQLERYLSMIGKARYTPPAPVAVPVTSPVVTTVVQSTPANTATVVAEEKTPPAAPSNETDEEREERVKRMVQEADRASELVEVRDGLIKTVPPIILMKKIIFPAAFAKAKQPLQAFLLACRQTGCTMLNQVDVAYFESGKGLVIRPKDTAQLAPKSEIDENAPLFREVIVEGKVLEPKMRHLGVNAAWLQKRMLDHGYTDPRQIFLGVCSRNGDLLIIPY